MTPPKAKPSTKTLADLFNAAAKRDQIEPEHIASHYAKKCGVASVTIRDWMAGRYYPTVPSMHYLSSALKVPITTIIMAADATKRAMLANGGPLEAGQTKPERSQP